MAKMLVQRCALVATLLVTATLAADAATVRVTNCPAHFTGRFEGEQETNGPYRLVSAHCTKIKESEQLTAPALAPDGRAIARLRSEGDLLDIIDLESGRAVSVPNPVTLPGFSMLDRQSPPIAWLIKPRAVLTVTQHVMVPSHFALSGLTVHRVNPNGASSALPPLTSAAGPLDAIEWVGNAGLAVAQFGTSGSYYRPEHADRAPEVAMVDTLRGKMLDRLPLSHLAFYRNRRSDAIRSLLQTPSATILPDGRMRVLIPTYANWIIWTQGEAAKEVAKSVADIGRARAALSRAGNSLLVGHDLQPSGVHVICEGPCPPSAPPKPRTGPLLSLHDLKKGAALWTLTATVDRFWNGHIFKISDDGLYALISYPPQGIHQELALVRMNDGSVVQKIPFGVSGGDAGFADGGRIMWTRLTNVVSIYRRNQ